MKLDITRKKQWFRLLSILIILLFVRKLFYSLYHKYKRYPPGPGIGYPVFGFFLHLITSPKQFMTHIAKKYGKIVFFPVGMNNIVYINDSKLARQLFTKKQFYNRGTFTNGILKPPNFGIENGNEWKKRRAYAQQSLFQLCDAVFILKHMKNILNKEIFDDLNTNYVQNKKLFYPLQHLQYIAFNNLFSAIFNQSLSINDKWSKKYISDIYSRNENLTAVVLLNTFCPIQLPDFIVNTLCSNLKCEQLLDTSLINWMQKEGDFIVDVDANILRRNKCNNNNIHNKKVYIDLLIEEIRNNNITVLEAMHDIKIFFIAGLDTTINVSEYGLLTLAKYPSIQEKVYNELKCVMLQNNKKEFDFHIIQQLHIFRAFIYEVLRISDVVPSGIHHKVLAEYKVVTGDDAYVMIPKNCVVSIHSHYIHKWQSWNSLNNAVGDECKLQEDNDIHLEYWLNDKDEFTINDNFVGFGLGKRDCVGREMAIKVLFATFALLMTKYKFVAPNNNPNNMNIKQKWGTVQKVEPKIGIIIEQRKQ